VWWRRSITGSAGTAKRFVARLLIVVLSCAGLMLVAEQPALADGVLVVTVEDPAVLPSAFTIGPSKSVTIVFHVATDAQGTTATGTPTAGIDSSLTGVSLFGDGQPCGTLCTWQPLDFNHSGKSYTVKLTGPSTVPSSANGNLTFSVTGAQPIIIPIILQAPTTVPEVSGSVVDILTGVGIPEANVSLLDGANHTYSTVTDKQGKYKFLSNDQQPIVPGTLTVGAVADNYEYSATGQPGVSKDGVAGVPLTGVKISLKSTASASAGSVPPTDILSTAPADTGVAAPIDSGRKPSSGPSTLSWILIVLGGVLVLLGIGAVVLLMIRRRDDEDDIVVDKPEPRRFRTPRAPMPGGRPPGPPPRQMPGRPPVPPMGPGGPRGMPGPRPAGLDAPTTLQTYGRGGRPAPQGGRPGYGGPMPTSPPYGNPGPGGGHGPGPYGSPGGRGHDGGGYGPQASYNGGGPGYGRGGHDAGPYADPRGNGYNRNGYDGSRRRVDWLDD